MNPLGLFVILIGVRIHASEDNQDWFTHYLLTKRGIQLKKKSSHCILAPCNMESVSVMWGSRLPESCGIFCRALLLVVLLTACICRVDPNFNILIKKLHAGEITVKEIQ